MLAPSHSVKDFIRVIQHKGYVQMVRLIEKELDEAVERMSGSRWQPKPNPRSSEQYVRVLKGLLFFIRTGHKDCVKPAGIHEWEFQLFRPVCENLARRDMLNPAAMSLFRRSSERVLLRS
jgi:hypothetical protein